MSQSTWLDEYFNIGGQQGDPGPPGPPGPPGEGTVKAVTLVGNGTGTGGRFEIGDVVCSANDPDDEDAYKLATSANLTSSDPASIRVMVETGYASESKLSAGPNTRLPPSVLGLSSSATIDKVILNTTTGRAARAETPASTDYVIGETDLEGNTTLIIPEAPVFGRAKISRRDKFDFRDLRPAGNGSSTDMAKFVEFCTQIVQANTDGHIEPTASGYLFDDVINLHDTTAGGNLRGFTLRGGYGGRHSANHRPHFKTAAPCPYGSAAAVDSFYSGTGQVTQVWNLGTWNTNYFGARVTVSGKEKYIGRSFYAWNTSDPINLGEFIIVGVPADDHITVANPRTGGGGVTGTDANNGSIRWRIYVPTFDIRGRDWTLDGLKFSVGDGRFGPIIEINQQADPVGAGLSVSSFTIKNTMFFAATASRLARCGLEIAKDIVPRAGNLYSSTNGNGDLQTFQTVQVDEFIIENVTFQGMAEGDVRHPNSNGQSKTGVMRRVAYNPSIRKGNTSGLGYYVPRSVYNAGNKTYSATGNPQVSHEHCVFGSKDLVLLFGGSNSGGVKAILNCYAESAARFFRDASASSLILMQGGSISHSATYLHPSKEFIFCQNDGPLVMIGTEIKQPDGLGAKIVIHSPASKTAKLVMLGALVQGQSQGTTRKGRLVGRRCGPYYFTSGQTFTFEFNSSGVQYAIGGTTVTNFARAGAGVVDLTEVESWQLGMLLNGATRIQNASYDVGAVIQPTSTSNPRSYVVTVAGTTANVSDPTGSWSQTLDATITDGTVTLKCMPGHVGWGEWDNHPPSVESKTGGTGGRVRCHGGTANAQVDFDTASNWQGQVQTQISIDTNGLIDHPALAGAEPISAQLTSFGVISCPYTPYTNTHTSFPEGVTHYGTSHAVWNEQRVAAGGSFTATNASALTLEGSGAAIAAAVTVAGAVVTIADPRATARSLIRLTPTNAAAVTLGVPYESARAGGSFSYTFPGSPAGTETYRYSIVEPS